MGAPAAKVDSKSLNDRLLDLLDIVDYKIVATDAEREEIFRLRYDAYIRDNGIVPRFDRRLSDRYDDLDNTTIYALYIGGRLATTIRCSIVSEEFPECPSMEVFGDLLEPYLKAGQILIDPTRHANHDEFSVAYPGLLPYMTLRIPWMLAEHYGADAVLGGVRAEHRAFYRRTFGSRQLGEARLYPTLVRPHYLTYGDYKGVREQVHQRFPSFRSSAFERRMLIEGVAKAAESTGRTTVHRRGDAAA
ncbi:MAG: hypothetical protein KIS96_05655 [Bauldia sp.]|nr:hypothetical protein [Bauldia sp.]